VYEKAEKFRCDQQAQLTFAETKGSNEGILQGILQGRPQGQAELEADSHGDKQRNHHESNWLQQSSAERYPELSSLICIRSQILDGCS
jgi:hypothetical protein